jgi:cation diffusion facilitator family transporter
MFNTKKSAAALALGVVLGLFVAKLAVAAITGSISIFAQMADSFLDILSVSLTYFIVLMANKPADIEHPFGHGKLENISAVVQAVLIFGAGTAVVYSAVQRLIHGPEINLPAAGIGVMAASVIVSSLLSLKLRSTAKSTDSPALEAISQNIRADIFSAGGVLLGMLAIFLSSGRLAILDPVLAIMVSLFIFRSGYVVITHSFGALIDKRLPADEEKIIMDTILDHNTQLIGMHELRSRKSGSQRYVDLHLVMPKNSSVEQAHEMCDHLEEDLSKKLANLNVTIHVEPCDNVCQACNLSCSSRPSP